MKGLTKHSKELLANRKKRECYSCKLKNNMTFQNFQIDNVLNQTLKTVLKHKKIRISDLTKTR